MTFRDRDSLFSAAVLAGVVGYFLAFSVFGLDRVFLFGYDDLAKGVLSRRLLSALSGARPLSPGLSEVLMLSDYVGQAPQLLAVVFLFLFSGLVGPIMAFKLTIVFCGALVLACVFGVLRKLVSRPVALWTVFFLGTNSMFIHAVRYGFRREEVFQVASLWLGLYLVFRSRDSGRRGWLYPGLFVFGVGLWAKMMFLGYIIGAAAGMLALDREARESCLNSLFPSHGAVAAGLLAFAAGCWPLLWYNFFFRPFETLRVLSAPLRGSGLAGPGKVPLWLAGNLAMGVKDVFHYPANLLFREDLCMHGFGLALACCAFGWALFRFCSLPAADFRRRLIAFLAVAYIVLLALSSVVPGPYLKGHFIIMVPAVEIFCALFAVDVTAALSRAGRVRLARVTAALIAVFWLAGGLCYESARLRLQGAGRGYPSDSFMVSDLEKIIGSLDEMKVDSLFCSYDLSGAIEFLRPDRHVLAMAVGPDDIVCQIEDFKDARGKWYLLTSRDGDEEKSVALLENSGMGLELKTEFFCRAGAHERFYLYRILRGAENNTE